MEKISPQLSQSLEKNKITAFHLNNVCWKSHIIFGQDERRPQGKNHIIMDVDINYIGSKKNASS